MQLSCLTAHKMLVNDEILCKMARWPGRNIVVDGVNWRFKIGHKYVVAHSEHGHRLCELLWRVMGFSGPELFENCAVTPRDVCKWISKEAGPV